MQRKKAARRNARGFLRDPERPAKKNPLYLICIFFRFYL